MKRLFIFSTFLLCMLSTTFSQQSGNTIKPNLKYGKPSKMNAYAPDTSATAVVLYPNYDVHYNLLANDFRIPYNYKVKLKILTSESASYADIQDTLLLQRTQFDTERKRQPACVIPRFP